MKPDIDPPGPPEPSATQAASDIRTAFSRLRRRLFEISDADDLTPSQTAALSRVSKGEAATASALASSEGVRPQSMAATLAALEQHGLVARTPDASDGRKQIVTLTDAGRARVEGDRHAREEWLSRSLSDHLTEDERQIIIAAMAALERLTLL